MPRAAAQTSIMPMALVAVEQYFPKSQRIIDDQLVSASSGIQAVVNLGAGFDTRSYRLPALAGLPVWEIDQRDNIRAKDKRLRKSLGKVPANVKLVAADFDRDDLSALLAAHDYSTGKPTFFIWEAVTQYLTEPGVRRTFDWLAQAASGSRLVFTYVRKDFLDGSNRYAWETGYRQFVASKVWSFGLYPGDSAAFLKGYGWRIIEDVGYDELAGKYILPTGRPLASTAVERMVHAEKT